jgi:hypothetical protein
MRRNARVVLVASDEELPATARVLRDAGFEVIALGDTTDPAVAETVLQEDADAVGVLGAGTDDARVRRIAGLLHDRGLSHVVVLGGPDLTGPDPAAALGRALGDREARPAG